ncbi:MAG: sigma-70 family RNA polymerase sigma factor [Caulobacteraceae bacterium]|nr:sigma-70 family RNA polymerase sigma factor [Caulobacter sp.]
MAASSDPTDATAARERLTRDLEATAGGDRRALERVYEATSAKLYGVCLRILHDEAEAEDTLQDVYLTIWRRAGAFDPARGVSPVTWLAAIARNRAIDRLRADRSSASRPLEAAAQAPDPAPLASHGLEQRQEAARLNGCLEALPQDHAAAVRAAFFGGFTYAALAEAAAVPLGTMKSRIRRSLQQLKGCLDHG